MKHKQRGYYNMDLSGLIYLAAIGLIAILALLFVGVPWLLWWLWDTFDIVRAK